jgi:hypothetical protein
MAARNGRPAPLVATRCPMSLTRLECQVSELVHSDTCPRPTTRLVRVHPDHHRAGTQKRPQLRQMLRRQARGLRVTPPGQRYARHAHAAARAHIAGWGADLLRQLLHRRPASWSGVRGGLARRRPGPSRPVQQRRPEQALELPRHPGAAAAATATYGMNFYKYLNILSENILVDALCS